MMPVVPNLTMVCGSSGTLAPVGSQGLPDARRSSRAMEWLEPAERSDRRRPEQPAGGSRRSSIGARHRQSTWRELSRSIADKFQTSIPCVRPYFGSKSMRRRAHRVEAGGVKPFREKRVAREIRVEVRTVAQAFLCSDTVRLLSGPSLLPVYDAMGSARSTPSCTEPLAHRFGEPAAGSRMKPRLIRSVSTVMRTKLRSRGNAKGAAWDTACVRRVGKSAPNSPCRCRFRGCDRVGRPRGSASSQSPPNSADAPSLSRSVAVAPARTRGGRARH